jgi:calcineurin-like phosphoesterase family protein
VFTRPKAVHLTGRVLFTADTHWNHARAIGHSDRPFADVGEMDRLMVEAWNATVGPDDTVFHLGDFAWKMRSDRMAPLFRSLHGRKHLIAGNHDHGDTFALPWLSIHERLTVALDGHRIVLDHYPLRAWNRAYHGSLHLHGHTHGALAGTKQSTDVGVDVWSYRPVTLPEILARMAASPDAPEERRGEE